jgi:hypothetical protein
MAIARRESSMRKKNENWGNGCAFIEFEDYTKCRGALVRYS